MLDPAWARVVLRDLLVTLAANLAIVADRDRSRAGGPFVEAQDDFADRSGFQVRLRLPVE